MLPECRLNEYTYPIPPFKIEKDDVENFVGEFMEFHGEYSDCFVRSEPGKNFFDYVIGQLSHLGRKSMEPMAVSVNGTNSVRSMQRAISDAVWNEDKILCKHQDMVRKEMGDTDGVLTFDESGFAKKGDCSAAVSRQYNGEIGKVDNCQVGVFAGYASPKGYTLVDKRLFIPEKWLGDDYEKKRIKCNFPEDIIFKTKPELAAEMYRDIVGLPCLSDMLLPTAFMETALTLLMLSNPMSARFIWFPWHIILYSGCAVLSQRSTHISIKESSAQNVCLPTMKKPPCRLAILAKIFAIVTGTNGQFPKGQKARLNMSSLKGTLHWPKTDCPIKMSG